MGDTITRRQSLAVLAGLTLFGAPPARAGAFAFSLLDQDGRRVTERDLAGRALLMAFGFTHCPAICPTTVQEMSVVYSLLPPALAARVTPVFVTVDPRRDTPAVLKTFIGNFDAPILALSGDEASVDALAWQLGIVAVRNGEGEEDYSVDHSTETLLVRDGMVLERFPFAMSAETLAARLAKSLA